MFVMANSWVWLSSVLWVEGWTFWCWSHYSNRHAVVCISFLKFQILIPLLYIKQYMTATWDDFSLSFWDCSVKGKILYKLPLTPLFTPTELSLRDFFYLDRHLNMGLNSPLSDSDRPHGLLAFHASCWISKTIASCVFYGSGYIPE